MRTAIAMRSNFHLSRRDQHLLHYIHTGAYWSQRIRSVRKVATGYSDLVSCTTNLDGSLSFIVPSLKRCNSRATMSTRMGLNYPSNLRLQEI